MRCPVCGADFPEGAPVPAHYDERPRLTAWSAGLLCLGSAASSESGRELPDEPVQRE